MGVAGSCLLPPAGFSEFAQISARISSSDADPISRVQFIVAGAQAGADTVTFWSHRRSTCVEAVDFACLSGANFGEVRIGGHAPISGTKVRSSHLTQVGVGPEACMQNYLGFPSA